MLAGGAKAVNAAKNNGMSALLMAASRGLVDILEMLLTVNTLDPGVAQHMLPIGVWTSPLLEACNSGHLATAHLLVNYRASLESACPDGDCPLITATRAGHQQIVRALLDAKATSFTAAVSYPCFTPLYFAALQVKQKSWRSYSAHGQAAHRNLLAGRRWRLLLCMATMQLYINSSAPDSSTAAGTR